MLKYYPYNNKLDQGKNVFESRDDKQTNYSKGESGATPALK